MPYITRADKERIDAWGGEALNVGDLTYILFKESVKYLKNSSGRYADRAEVVAALECAKREFQRRYMDDYEQMKLEENGDVG